MDKVIFYSVIPVNVEIPAYAGMTLGAVIPVNVEIPAYAGMTLGAVIPANVEIPAYAGMTLGAVIPAKAGISSHRNNTAFHHSCKRANDTAYCHSREGGNLLVIHNILHLDLSILDSFH